MFSLMEIFDAAVMSLIVGIMFKDVFRPHRYEDDPVSYYRGSSGLWMAIALVAPAIILHELGHKFVAMAFGMSATFHAAYTFLALGLILKLVGSPIIFFVPAFVQISGSGLQPLPHALIAFAGPGVNLLLFVASVLILKFAKLKSKQAVFFVLTKRINLMLFGFNLIPIPGFDGYQIFSSLFAAL